MKLDALDTENERLMDQWLEAGCPLTDD